MKTIKLLIISLIAIMLCGCELIDDEKQRDKAIEECKNAGGIPFVENYDDKHYRPIVHCNFGGNDENNENN